MPVSVLAAAARQLACLWRPHNCLPAHVCSGCNIHVPSELASMFQLCDGQLAATASWFRVSPTDDLMSASSVWC
jgi:hypothetical protein